MRQEIFDIQTSSFHDGPGIRTTVFLKGCPLRCQWCSNPEGLEKGPTLSYQKAKCTSCLACVESCPSGALTANEGSLEVRQNLCTACGACLDVCPTGALKLYGHQKSPAAILEILRKDRKYFEKSGGGLTLSGGEVMMQPEYALEILKLAKEDGFHTCIETSGFAETEDFKKILPYVDLFLFDYKLSDPEKHKSYTGVSNEKILENLKFLSEQGARITLRAPIIPGVNDHEAHFWAIAEISRRFSAIRGVEVLPYHNWGEHKYEEIAWKQAPLQTERVAEDVVNSWVEMLKALDCKNVTES